MSYMVLTTGIAQTHTVTRDILNMDEARQIARNMAMLTLEMANEKGFDARLIINEDCNGYLVTNGDKGIVYQITIHEAFPTLPTIFEG